MELSCPCPISLLCCNHDCNAQCPYESVDFRLLELVDVVFALEYAVHDAVRLGALLAFDTSICIDDLFASAAVMLPVDVQPGVIATFSCWAS